MISIFNDNYSVLGVAATKKLEKNECIYIKYSELNDAIKEKLTGIYAKMSILVNLWWFIMKAIMLIWHC